VLLVEDEVLISHLVAAALNEHGFNVHEMTTADEALRYMHAGGAVDVLFTDVNLPGSMNGAELALRAREMRPDLPIVYASGRYRPTDIGALVPRSMFVSKPYDPEDVGRLLTRLTEGSH
ncbi:MAG: response regulator, partial [Rhizobiales bacterium]|nr:response regulator [Hyphomicrobiales bacterium]